MKLFKTFAECRGLTTMGLGMLIGGSFLHLVSALVKEVIFPLLHTLFLDLNTVATPEIDQKLTIPHLMLSNGGLGHTFLVFVIVCVTSHYFLKWSNELIK